MKILITGGHGCLGSKLKTYYPNAFAPTHSELDIKNDLSGEFDLVIHCAALKPGPCNTNKREAMLTNIQGTINVAELCHKSDAKMVYISTDYVFRGDRGDYAWDDEVCPQNYYGESKLAGEYVTKSVPNHLIIRLSFFPDQYPYDNAFVDQFTTKIPVSEAAREIFKLIVSGAQGVHHISGPKGSVYDYALRTAHGKHIDQSELADVERHETDLKRPRDTSLLAGGET